MSPTFSNISGAIIDNEQILGWKRRITHHGKDIKTSKVVMIITIRIFINFIYKSFSEFIPKVVLISDRLGNKIFLSYDSIP